MKIIFNKKCTINGSHYKRNQEIQIVEQTQNFLKLENGEIINITEDLWNFAFLYSEPAPILPFKIFEEIDVKVSFQNFGINWLIILRGNKEDINLIYNSFYNWGACKHLNNLEFYGDFLATFWSTEALLDKYFLNHFENLNYPSFSKFSEKILNKKFPPANEYVQNMLQKLKQHSESFLKFDKNITNYYEIGRNNDSKPDHDFKSHVLEHAFRS